MIFSCRNNFKKGAFYKALCFVVLTSLSTQASGEGHSSEPAAAEPTKVESVSLAPPADYCANIKMPAQEARFAYQLKTLEDLQKKIDEKISILDEKHKEILALEEQQKEKMKSAQKMVVDIYSKMKPDVAAGQLELLDPEIAVGILDQLKVRASSSILNEMKGPSAAVITALMASNAKVAQP
jgi:flagellar motility protein MotE (MotC chaperone)